ncbi:GumC family protein [Brucella gallinifaecis]|uniref:GumC family protein n=1 Tax=Brucella gallinifaecis TaxID=215590 RepID=UPI002362E67B|nr:Wzz/FepE/Etk N-terminal domain-containing protein [Brucella gallinifaecis]
MSEVDSQSKDVDIDIGALFISLRRHWLLVLGGAAVLAVLAWLFCLLITPDYRAEARIFIESRESVFTRPNGEATIERPLVDPEGIKSQVEIMTSGDLLKQVSDKLKLTDNPTFTSTIIKPWVRLLILVGLRNNPEDLTPEELVLQKLRQNLKVFNGTDSGVIVVQYTSPNAGEAADIANAVADGYIALQEAAKLQSNDDATGWLAPEIEDLREKVRDSEKKVADYRSSQGLLTGQANSTIAAQQLSEITSELSRVRASRAATEARAESVRHALSAGIAFDTLPDVVASGMMQRLSEHRIELNSQIADLSVTLLEGHPRIKALRSQLADIDRQISAEGRKLLTSLNNEVNAAKLREEELSRELNRLKSQAAQTGTQEVELRALEREVIAQRQLLETYLTRYQEAASRNYRNYIGPDARIFSRADAPSEPYYPKVLTIVSATFVAGLVVLSIFAVSREFFSGRTFTAADRRRYIAAEEIEMPVIKAATDIAFEESSGKTPMSQYRAVRRWTSPFMSGAMASLEENTLPVAELPHSVKAVAARLMTGQLQRVIAVSPEGDKASALTVRLIRELADSGKRAILIDMTAHGTLGLVMLEGRYHTGITELLSGERRFNDVIYTDHFSQAHIMPLGKVEPETAMRSVDRLPYILDALETVYDFVVVECGPSTSRQIRRIMDGPAAIIMNIVDPDNNDVAAAAIDMDQGGYEDVIILMDSFSNVTV